MKMLTGSPHPSRPNACQVNTKINGKHAICLMRPEWEVAVFVSDPAAQGGMSQRAYRACTPHMHKLKKLYEQQMVAIRPWSPDVEESNR